MITPRQPLRVMTFPLARGGWVRRSRRHSVAHVALLLTGSYILSLRDCQLGEVRWCMTSNQTPGTSKFRPRMPRPKTFTQCMPSRTTAALSSSMRTARRSTEEAAVTQIGTHSTLALRQGPITELPGPFSSASNYKCAKLTLPTPATRALELPEVVARARRVAPKWSRPLRVQDHSF